MKNENLRELVEMKIRYAEPSDAKVIVNIVVAGFRKELLNAMIYGCKGVVTFLESQISIPLNVSDTIYIVAEIDGNVVGFAEFKIYPENIFLNYIGTSKQVQHRGLATKLLGKSISMVRTKYHKRMALDVFSDNFVAKYWYNKLGFREEYNAGWYKIEQKEVDEGDFLHGKVSGYSQSNCCYGKFGFSHFNVTTAAGHYNIGLLGEEWFRITEFELLFDCDALSCLYSIDSSRSMLGIFKEIDQANIPVNAACFCSSIRMSIPLDMLERNIFY